MNPVQGQINQCYILYDGDVVGQVESEWFSVDYWRTRSAVVGQAQGRGTAWFISYQQQQWVLRNYRRGGQMAPLLGDRYLWTGLENSRAWREWRLLARLAGEGLPVAAPVAAQLCRRGIFYSAQLITVRLSQTRSLAQALRQGHLDSRSWQGLGRTLKQFHLHGVCHADLNAHNILLGEGNRLYLIDFDRATLRAPGAWQQANLLRLRRSLYKLSKQHHTTFYFNELNFATLLQSYADYSGTG
ncbi:MAG: 3-deoxy-D-manno-octulosonic acid kinase [Gammaproteobacteria bacterium]|nr:3-deoxy-D-manno-octulosonic acid kinase [Gammaproteobacteria bacterium]